MKLKEFQKKLIEKKLDAALFLSADSSFFYFVGQKIENSIVIIPAKGKPILLVNNLEQVKVRIQTVIYKEPYKVLKKLLLAKKIKLIGINESYISIKQKKELKINHRGLLVRFTP